MNHQELEKIASQLSDLTNYPEGYVPDISKQYYRTKRLQQELLVKPVYFRWFWVAASIIFISGSLVLIEVYTSTPINEIALSNKQGIKSPAITKISGSKKHVVDNLIINGRSSTGVEYPLSDTSSKTVEMDSVIEPKVISVLTVMKSTDTAFEKASPKWVNQLKKQRKYNIISIAPQTNHSQPKLTNRNFDFFVIGDRGFELIKRLPQKEETIIYPNHEYKY